MAGFTESEVEEAALEYLAGLGYAVLRGPDIAPDGPAPERANYAEVLLIGRLRGALRRLNPHLPAETLAEVLRKVRQTETPSLRRGEPPLAPLSGRGAYRSRSPAMTEVSAEMSPG